MHWRNVACNSEEKNGKCNFEEKINNECNGKKKRRVITVMAVLGHRTCRLKHSDFQLPVRRNQAQEIQKNNKSSFCSIWKGKLSNVLLYRSLYLLQNMRKSSFRSSTLQCMSSQPDNFVPLCKFKIIIIIHFFRNWFFSQSMNTWKYLHSGTKSSDWLRYCHSCVNSMAIFSRIIEYISLKLGQYFLISSAKNKTFKPVFGTKHKAVKFSFSWQALRI